MWDTSSYNSWDFLYFDWQLMRELPKGRYGVDYDKYNFETPFSFSIHMLEPLQRYRLGYDRNGFRLDLTFEATTEPHEIGSHTEHGLDGALQAAFRAAGRITGTMELNGEAMKVDCFSIRDGSHGRRNLETCTPGGYAWSTADAKTGWHCWRRCQQLPTILSSWVATYCVTASSPR